MSFTTKIEEWMKEAEERPESAVTIVRLIARRLRELSERDEELLAENIALQNGSRVEEYQKRIAHLEYQLDLLKRHFDVDEASLVELPAKSAETSTLSVLIYNTHGRIFRLELNPRAVSGGSAESKELGRIMGEMVTDQEPPRILAVPSNEDVLLLFTSGRITTYSVGNIPTVDLGGAWDWSQATLPDEPRAGEVLACIAPFSQFPLSDFFLQVSRRGCAKKTMTSMAQSILNNHYIGKGSIQKSDQPFDLMLAHKKDRAAFVTYEGKIIGFDVDELSYATDERVRLTATDYVIASFTAPADTTLLCVTQNGKVIQRESKNIELSKSSTAKGQSLIPPSRLEQGVRFMGAAAVRDSDSVIVLDATGRLSVYEAGAMTGAGSIAAEGWILSIGVIHSQA
jgi:DNA gyrase/topoisomerase IV subunit A